MSTAGVPCSVTATLPVTPDLLTVYLTDIQNLPTWTGFFRSVGRRVEDRHEVITALGTRVLTRIEQPTPGRVVISSLVQDREERAELALTGARGDTIVRFTVTLRPALVQANSQHSGGDGVEGQRDLMQTELARLGQAAAQAT